MYTHAMNIQYMRHCLVQGSVYQDDYSGNIQSNVLFRETEHDKYVPRAVYASSSAAEWTDYDVEMQTSGKVDVPSEYGDTVVSAGNEWNLAADG